MNINKKIKTTLLGLGLMAFLLLLGVQEAQCATKFEISCNGNVDEPLKVGSTVDAAEVMVRVSKKGGFLRISTSDPSVATVAQDSITLSRRTETTHVISLTALRESREVELDVELFKINRSGDEVFFAKGSCSFSVTD